MIVQPGGGFESVGFGECPVPEPGQGEITVRLRVSSLNYHDYALVSGMRGPSEPRVPMSDGAGEVEAVGPGGDAFAVGDRVVSTFFPTKIEGPPLVKGFATVPGDGIDGYARERVTASAIEVTYRESGYEPVPPLNDRFAALVPTADLFIAATAPAPTTSPCRQLFRQHCLAVTILDPDLADYALLALIAPSTTTWPAPRPRPKPASSNQPPRDASPSSPPPACSSAPDDR